MNNKFSVTFFEQLITVCKERLSDILIDTSIEKHKEKTTLSLIFDFRSEDLIKYPIWNNQNISEDLYDYDNTALHVYFFDKKTAHFYFQGWVYENENKKEIEYVDDEGFNLEAFSILTIEVNEPEEFVELIRFFKVFSINGLNQKKIDFSFSETDFFKIFKNVYVFIPEFSEQIKELSLVQKRLDLIECERVISGKSYFDDFEEYNENQESFEEYKERFNEFNKRTKDFLATQTMVFQGITSDQKGEIMPNDLLVRMGDFEIFPFFEYKRITDKAKNNHYDQANFQDNSVYFVFRPKDIISYTFLNDFLTTTNEGIQFIKDLATNLFKPHKIKFISDYNSQFLFALEKKIYRYKISEMIRKLIASPEESEIALSNIKKRYNQLESFYHTDYKLLEIYKNPLPYSIDRAFRKFIRASDHLEAHTCGLHLLNVLIKSRIMLPLEEYLQKCQSKDDPILLATEELLFKKPPTDGTIRDLYNLFSKHYPKSGIELSCFGYYHAALNNKDVDEKLRELIETRNRFAHPPYMPFFNLLNNLLPELIQLYREAFENIEIIVPIKFEIKNKKPVLSAKRLMGMDEDFETINIEVPLNVILEFETNTLLAWNKKTQAIVKFERFLKLQVKDAPKFEIGFFDRLEKGNPIFKF